MSELERYGVIEALTPTGDGWWYPQDFNGTTVRIPPTGTAGGAKELIEQVKRFRAQNRIPLADYIRDIADHIKRVSPLNDKYRGKPTTEIVPESPTANKRALLNRIEDWLYAISFKEPKPVSQDEKNARAAICAQCRQNVKWQTGCSPCVQGVEDRGKAVRRKSGDEEADKLLACRLHELYLPAAVFLDRDFLPTKKPDAPAECWLPNP